jgi:hypothetical protein
MKFTFVLQLCKQLEMLSNLPVSAKDDSRIEYLKAAVALTQHHDAVT